MRNKINHQFKVGDKVRIKENARELCRSKRFRFWDSQMNRHGGKLATVEWDYKDGDLLIRVRKSYVYPAYALELIDPGKDA